MSTKQKHVQFDEILASPPADRVRLGVSYPSVAQVKGSPERRGSKDLYWGIGPLSAVGELPESEEQGSSLGMCAEEAKQAGHVKKALDDKLAEDLPLVVHEMLSVACEALTGLSSSRQAHGRAQKPNLHLSWHCADTTIDSTPASTPSTSCYGSSDCSTSNSSSSSPSSEAPASSILGK